MLPVTLHNHRTHTGQDSADFVRIGLLLFRCTSLCSKAHPSALEQNRPTSALVCSSSAPIRRTSSGSSHHGVILPMWSMRCLASWTSCVPSPVPHCQPAASTYSGLCTASPLPSLSRISLIWRALPRGPGPAWLLSSCQVTHCGTASLAGPSTAYCLC